MSVDYSYWQDALAGKDMASRTHDGDPQPGFYRNRIKNKQTGSISWVPVAYYPVSVDNHHGLVCHVNGTNLSDQAAKEIWTYVCRHPVTEEAWRAVSERKEPWPDQDSIVADQTAGIGDNSGAVDEAEALADQIKSAAAGKGKYLKIASTDQSAAAQSLRARLMELAGNAKKIHKTLKEPHWNKCKEIDDKWLPLAKEAEGAAAAIKAAIDRYTTTLLQAQRAAEAAAASSDMMEEPEAAPVVPQTIKGAYGRAASVRETWIVKEITDYDALYQHFKTNAAVKEVLEKLAKSAIKIGEVPGVVRIEVAAIK